MNIKDVIKKEIQTQVIVGTGDDTLYPNPDANPSEVGIASMLIKKQKYIQVVDIDKLVNVLVKIMGKANVGVSDIIDL